MMTGVDEPPLFTRGTRPLASDLLGCHKRYDEKPLPNAVVALPSEVVVDGALGGQGAGEHVPPAP